MTDLIRRLEEATGPMFVLDKEIAQAVGWHQIGEGSDWFDLNGTQRNAPPPFTASLDAAMTLIPEGCISWNVGDCPGGPTAWVLLADLREFDGFPRAGSEFPAIALCIACLKARA